MYTDKPRRKLQNDAISRNLKIKYKQISRTVKVHEFKLSTYAKKNICLRMGLALPFIIEISKPLFSLGRLRIGDFSNEIPKCCSQCTRKTTHSSCSHALKVS